MKLKKSQRVSCKPRACENNYPKASITIHFPGHRDDVNEKSESEDFSVSPHKFIDDLLMQEEKEEEVHPLNPINRQIDCNLPKAFIEICCWSIVLIVIFMNCTYSLI